MAAMMACSQLATPSRITGLAGPSADAAFSQRRASSLSCSLSSSPSLSSRIEKPRSQNLRGLKPLTRRSSVITNIAQPQEVETQDLPLPDPLSTLPVIKDGVDAATSPVEAGAATSAAEDTHTIFLSDVVATKKRPYFFNREYTSKDIQYIVYMVAVHGLCLAAPFTFSWDAFGSFVGMYIVTGMLGITLSYHRHLSHKSFVLPKWLEYFFAYCGVLAVQGSPMEWVSAHRFHHRHCDTDKDPHTPYEGFWHSHMGWLLDDAATSARVGERSNIADMQNDPFYIFIEKTYPVHVVGSALALYALGGFPYLVWGFAVRAVWVYHITWAVNSAAHVWGFQSWNTGDISKNNWWVAILAFGEGWHNNHHAFEYSARHGLEWWQYDPTWYTVKALEAAGLATKVRYPTADHMARLAFPADAAQQ